MEKVKERNFVNPFKLFFGNSKTEVKLSQSEQIDSCDLSKEEKEQLKKALAVVEEFEVEMNNTVEQAKHKAKPIINSKQKSNTVNEVKFKNKKEIEDRVIGE